jgi:hypothetical protein
MTRPAFSSRVLLVEDRRAASEAVVPVLPLRRYRLARLRFDDRRDYSKGRFSWLKRAHD